MTNETQEALEALEELRSVCSQYAYPRFDILAKIIRKGIENNMGTAK